MIRYYFSQHFFEQIRLTNIPLFLVQYDKKVDILTIEFSSSPVQESDEESPGFIFDYDKDGKIVGMEILEASKRLPNPQSLPSL